MMGKINYVETKYGFEYGPAKVERMASDNGHVWIEIRTKRGALIVRVTPTGLIKIEEGSK